VYKFVSPKKNVKLEKNVDVVEQMEKSLKIFDFWKEKLKKSEKQLENISFLKGKYDIDDDIILQDNENYNVGLRLRPINNNCFLNVSLQFLVSIKEFDKLYLKGTFSNVKKIIIIKDDSESEKFRKIALNLVNDTSKKVMRELFEIRKNPMISLTPLKKLLDVGKRIVGDRLKWDKQDDALETLQKILLYQSYAVPDSENLTKWTITYQKKDVDANEIVASTVSHENILIIKEYKSTLVECLDHYFDLNKNVQLMRRNEKTVLVTYQEKFSLSDDIPPIAIIQFGFRRTRMNTRKWSQILKKYVIHSIDIKNTDDIEIEKN